MLNWRIPPFRPHRLLRGGHAQTLAGAYLPDRLSPYNALQHRVALDDGDQLVLHDDRPAGWHLGQRVVLMIHGLAGSHESGYMRRIAAKLNAVGVRAFRLDLRGCGAGRGLARRPYHSGRSPDAAAAIEWLAETLPDSPVTLVGFSLGANITLKLLGELGTARCGHLDSAMAVCPPVDLASCSAHISRWRNRPYNRFFVRSLLGQLAAAQRTGGDSPQPTFVRRPRTLWEFDNEFTAVAWGFGSADHYYSEASSAPLVAAIRKPTLILAAEDDPMIPPAGLMSVRPPPDVRLHMSRQGGHLGFVGRSGVDPDRRWMDWRVVDWVLAQSDLQPRSHRHGHSTRREPV